MSSPEIRLVVVGAGRWGKNHIRTALELLPRKNVIVCDPDEGAKSRIADFAPDTKIVADYRDLLSDVDAAIIATPAETHYAVAKDFLEAGVHCLVEKPITLRSEETDELIEIAERDNLRLMTGHVLLYHPAVVELKRAVDAGKIGKLQYLYSNRLNLGALRSEENILWSFAPHDISIIQHLVGASPEEVRCNGASFVQNAIEDATLTYLRYPGNVHAHIHVSWLHPFKEQRLVAIGDEGMFVFEDSSPDRKLRFYSKGFRKVGEAFEKFDSEEELVPFEPKAPLAEEQRHFFECVRTGATPTTDGRHAAEVLRVLEAAQRDLGKATDS